MIRVIKRRANGGRRVNARIGCEEKIESICFVPARSGTRVGSENTCVKSLTMAKASASRPAGLVTLEE